MSLHGLQARVGILQTEIEGCPFRGGKVPDVLTLRYPHAPVKYHPRFADLHGAVQHRKPLRKQILDNILDRRQVHL